MRRGLSAAAGAAILLLASPAAAAQADLVAGERLFRGQCMGCHSLEPGQNRAGPTLHALFGRRAGTLEGFDYSEAMAAADLEWSHETLDAFLADPNAVVPGTKMVFWGLRPDERRDVIAYLKVASE